MSDIQDDLNDLGKKEQVKRPGIKYEKADSFIEEAASRGPRPMVDPIISTRIVAISFVSVS